MIRAVIFDLDGTLFDRDSVVRSLAETQHHLFRDDLRHVPQGRFVARVVALDDHGYRDKREVYAILAKELNLARGLEESLFADFWSRYHSFCRPFPDVHETLRLLRERGKTLGIVTNGCRHVQDDTIDALGIRQLVDTILISEVEGIRKPDPGIFLRALSRLGVDAEEACYVGDHPETDVSAAKAVGMTAIWKRVLCWQGPTDTPSVAMLGELLTYAWLGAAEPRRCTRRRPIPR